jgi:hypothetical protein
MSGSDDPSGPREQFDVKTIGVAAQRGLGVVTGWKIALGVGAVVFGMLFMVGLFGAGNSSGSGTSQICTVMGGSGGEVPANYVPWLEKAATKYKLGPRGFSIVAAVHKIESDFGRSPLPGVRSGTNLAGAAGPGQFLAGTWTFYGVDGDGNGLRDIYSVADSVFATANYLHASGAPGDWRAALFAYNHAEWYVQEVLAVARSFTGEEVCRASPGPLSALPADRLQRIDYVARWIESKRIHYCWGGGHGPKPGPTAGSYCWSADGRQVFGADEEGLDCSGAVRWLLVLTGYEDPGGLRSDLLGATYLLGPGQHVTIWSNVDHIFVTIDGRDWGTSSSHFAHGPAFGGQSHAGFVASHPPGL